MLAFDILAPLTAIAALLAIGVVLGWPLWWVSVCSMLCLLIVQGVVVNAVLYRRDSVTVGTDDDGPGLRLAVVALAAATVVAALAVGYTRWTVPDRDFRSDTADVVRIATAVAEATATFTPGAPTASIDRAASFMAPERAEAYRNEFAKATADLAKRNVTAQAQTISAGLEALGPEAASVAVVMRGTQTQPGQPPDTAVLSLRVGLAKQNGTWLVLDVAPINSR
ncbi:membrane protein [Mycolicibacterium anyangense]|uniref:Membrane protein n=1 Tax=Mycolicibacterium anyangense TaxID=1431246 RepID=A0A6N4WDW2_9MYCO|nr:membrane protein [Mycolicibacterium anyangense]